MKLLAVSGGPDSMVMLYKNRKKDIVVAHVNYNARPDSMNDQNIVEEFCKRFDIPVKVLTLNEKPKTNFQAWARDVRYQFFKEVYDEFSCTELLVAQHKDDFLETALMQQESGREPRYFGIKKKTSLMGMVIHRPYIDKYWKNDMLELCKIYNIPFAIDSSNEKPVYTRNKKRIELAELSLKAKKQRLSWFKMANRILIKKHLKVMSYYKMWKRSEFSIKKFEILHYPNEILFEFLHEYGENIKITSDKITSIIDFIQSPNGKAEYKISSNQYIKKENKHLSIITK
ncbi:tRNA lysidine(34) synthetase TilS [Mycoplasma todarodis]|uniref:tRNA(Ile)-lysidine synthase n=1 Tax=Mycoplasma todarodis TaxID=1937191 RepID=A0A4R0XQR6_9MOLU|nr:tRNA lysidine(34) synthetase TilS [Mycoplasma todarodis]TCG10700.1 tRNA lysidine(34) synthetase TilS [Mycoplasma todarodis]